MHLHLIIEYFATPKMNEGSFWLMVSATPIWVNLGASERVIQASRTISSHLHVNTFFVKALGQVPTGARSMIRSAHDQGKKVGRLRW